MNGRGKPLYIVETVEVTVRNYNEVDADFAREEGKGDMFLDYWRQAHKTYFLRFLKNIDREFLEEMPLVCERFRVIFK